MEDTLFLIYLYAFQYSPHPPVLLKVFLQPPFSSIFSRNSSVIQGVADLLLTTKDLFGANFSRELFILCSKIVTISSTLSTHTKKYFPMVLTQWIGQKLLCQNSFLQ